MTESLPSHIKPLLAAILLNRFEPLAAHHVGALRELLEYPTDDELRSIVNPAPTSDHPSRDDNDTTN